VNIVRRYGTSPTERGSATGQSCPDILELETGDYAIIGQLPTEQVMLPTDASVGAGEVLVIVPRDVVLAAAREIAEQPGPA
jgi:hypothetical protein